VRPVWRRRGLFSFAESLGAEVHRAAGARGGVSLARCDLSGRAGGTFSKKNYGNHKKHLFFCPEKV